jgi:hypothetical protein
VQSEAELSRDDDAAPPSGVRVRVLTLRPAARARAERAAAPERTDHDELREVAEEVFLQVWSVVRALSPLQGVWLRVGLAQVAVASVELSTWQLEEQPVAAVLRRRWPELVPGSASLDRLAHLMVDTLCG